MTPNDIHQDLLEQLHLSGLTAVEAEAELDAHRRRREASIDAATSTMSMRVQRAMNVKRQAVRPRATHLALAMTAVAATVVMVVTLRPDRSTTTNRADSTFVGTTSVRTTERDVDDLTDELVRRSNSSATGWSVTDDDVDQLLGDAGLDL